MLNVKVEKINGILVTTSNRVAEELGVEHRSLLSKIDDYLNKFQSAKLSADFYILSNYKDNRNRTYRNYLITKKGIAQLIGGYSSAVERAFELNVAYINKFEEMEKALHSNKQLTFKVPASYEHMVVHTFRGIPVMETKTLCSFTNIPYNTLKFETRKREIFTIKSSELLQYKIENKEPKRKVSNLTILYKEQVTSLCKYFGIYENVKDIIEKYFKVDNKIEYKEEPKQEKSKHTLEELELVLKASEHLNEKLQRHCVAEHVIEEIMGVKFFDAYYTSKTAIIAKAEIEQMTPAERKMLKKKIETNKMYGLLEPKAKGIVDCVLGKE